MVSLTVYDGARPGIGGDKLHLEDDGQGRPPGFREELRENMARVQRGASVKNRDTRGIHDLMYLDLVPKLNIYRPDHHTLSDLSMSRYPSLNVAAVLLSSRPHGPLRQHRNASKRHSYCSFAGNHRHHEGHAGHRQHTSLEGDTTYFSPRQPSDEMGLYLSSVATINYQGRDFCCTKKPSEKL